MVYSSSQSGSRLFAVALARRAMLSVGNGSLMDIGRVAFCIVREAFAAVGRRKQTPFFLSWACLSINILYQWQKVTIGLSVISKRAKDNPKS